MIDILLYLVVALAVLAMFSCVILWLHQSDYDAWVREFEANGGIQWPIDKDPIFGAASHAQHPCQVLDGSEVVSYTVMTDRRLDRP